MPTSLNFCYMESAITYESYDDSNIDDKEQIRDLGIMMSNTATFTLHIRNIVKNPETRVFQCFSRGC